MRARISELAAPPGGWPNLTSELVEVRFYLQQGLFDDAYELLSIIQKRHPGHPQLAELAHRPKPTRRVDTDVLALVDSVLADSASLMGKMPRRAAPRWKGSAAPGAPRTGVHEVASADDDVPTHREGRSGKTGPNPASRGTGSQRAAGATSSRSATGSQRATGKATGSQRAAGKTGPQPRPRTNPPRGEASAQEPAPPRERTRIYRTVEPPRTVTEARAAEAARVEAAHAEREAAERAAAERAREARAAERAEAARAAERAKRTSQRVEAARAAAAAAPGRGGATVVVDALQPPAPYRAAEEAGPRPAPKGARKRRDADAAAPVPAAAAPQPAAADAQTDGEPKEARRRRASFGEHVLNRLR